MHFGQRCNCQDERMKISSSAFQASDRWCFLVSPMSSDRYSLADKEGTYFLTFTVDTRG